MRIAITFLVFFIGFSLSACQSTSMENAFATACEEPRSQICTMNYLPVCGYRSDGTVETFSNACTACSDTDVIGYDDAGCSTE